MSASFASAFLSVRPAAGRVVAPLRRLASVALLTVASLAAMPGLASAAGGQDAVVSTREMLSRIDQPWVQLIDVRSADEYAGRDIRALRGGHIPGAVSVPVAEAGVDGDTISAAALAGLRERLAGFDRRKETIVYGHDADTARRVAAVLREQGFRQVRVYAEAWQAWANTLELPVAGERYADVGAMRDRLLALQRELGRR